MYFISYEITFYPKHTLLKRDDSQPIPFAGLVQIPSDPLHYHKQQSNPRNSHKNWIL